MWLPRVTYERMNQYERSNTGGSSQERTGDTPSALLRAGRSLFARRGYDGASIRAITREAGSNLGSVTYHFGSKEGLYSAVLEEVLSPLAGKVAEAAAPGRGGVERVVAVVRAFFDHLDEHPDLPQLMLQEIAAGKPPPPPVEAFLRSVTGHLARIVREGQEAGEIRPGDPVLLGLSCVIQPIHLTLVRHWLGLVRPMEGAGSTGRKDVVEHAVAFARAGLTASREKAP